ncbi:MAG: PTS transporter subunit EIIC [Clostridia bacterium]|nr:PTS transporter subunit EIIC [Clostridia bacterium]
MKDKIFGVLQRVGRSFMLPIALLPAAGLLLGIGSSFTNATMLETYGLSRIIYPGSIIYTILDIMNLCGSVVFSNLPLLFAMGVAIGMAKQEKEVAALSGAIAYLVMNTAISAMINAAGGPEMLPANTTADVLGITSLQMGVFGGIIVGLGTAALHNRFYRIQLPQVLSFFGGTRFVPIICTGVFLLVGVAMFYIWPIVQRGIALLGQLVINTGYAGTWIYGIIERALIPFGLHHVFYMPFWQTAMGGVAVIDGAVVQGAQNIFFAELASRNTVEFSVSATRFMSGKFPFMIFGLPGAAYAMYRCAKPEKRRAVGSLLVSAALTSVLTGITEPIEFTFLFVAPLMYAVHCVLAGLSYMLMHILNVGVGMTFSGGLIDLTLFGILQGNAKTHWIWIIIVGIAYAALYYFVFLFLIKKLDLKTPGREDEGEAKLYTRSDYNAREKEGGVSALILDGLGGARNIADLDACATRLRVTVRDPGLVNDAKLKQSGASGVIRKGNGIQAIYGPQVSVIKSRLMEHIESMTDSADNVLEILGAHMQGEIVSLADIADEAFSSGALGPGVAIEPAEGSLYSPADGVINTIFETKHAVTMSTSSGSELLMHIGIDTVQLGGKHFTAHVEAGQHVKKGELLISFDMEAIGSSGYALTTPLIVCNSEEAGMVQPIAEGTISRSEDILSIHRRL